MKTPHTVGKRDFIQHTSRYIKEAETCGSVIITHQNKPVLKLLRLEEKSIKDLQGIITEIRILGDINEHEFEGYDEW